MTNYQRFENRPIQIRMFDDEKLDLIVVSTPIGRTHRHVLITLNIISIFVSFVCGTVTFFLAIEDQSTAALGFATDTILDVLAFSIIIWRFTTSRKSSQREMFASRLLATLLFLSGSTVLIFSIFDLANEQRPIQNRYLVIALIIQTLVFLCLSIGKFLVAERLRTVSAYSDAFNTFVAAAMAFSVAIGTAIYNANENIWYLDAMIGLVFSLMSVVYGLWMIRKSNENS